MSEVITPQIYLCTPPQIELSSFPGELARILDTVEIACVRLSLTSEDESVLSRSADALREVCHARDIPVVIDKHYRLVGPHGLDGVHLETAAKQIRDVRKELHKDAIIGAYCGIQRHAGMTAGEIGADYITFGPVSTPDLLGDGKTADVDLFQWWSEMIEVPVVAEGGLTREKIVELVPYTDFFSLSSEVWDTPDALTTLKEIKTLLDG